MNKKFDAVKMKRYLQKNAEKRLSKYTIKEQLVLLQKHFDLKKHRTAA